MNCRTVLNSLSEHLDGCLPSQHRQRVLQHLDGCPSCKVQFQQLSRVRDAIGKLPVAVPPAHLNSALRVMASQERDRRLARIHPFRHIAVRFQLWADNLMRPLALPFAGGLLSAVLLFGMLVPTFSFSFQRFGDDVPVALFTAPTLKLQCPFSYPVEDMAVEVLVDGQGRVVDYTITEGPDLPMSSALRRAIESNLLYTQFTPATAFGQPRYGKAQVKFTRTDVTVKS
jgi:hypothetical protein